MSEEFNSVVDVKSDAAGGFIAIYDGAPSKQSFLSEAEAWEFLANILEGLSRALFGAIPMKAALSEYIEDPKPKFLFSVIKFSMDLEADLRLWTAVMEEAFEVPKVEEILQ